MPRDSALFFQGLGAGTGNWKDALSGSIENIQQKAFFILTTDSAAAYDHGYIIDFNKNINTTNYRSRDDTTRFMRSAVSFIMPGNSIATVQHESSGAFSEELVFDFLSTMNLPAINWTIKDAIYRAVAYNHLAAWHRGEQDADLISFSYNSALPIQLSSFVARSVNTTSTELKWTTISEINNYGFEIQRSSDNAHYMSIPGVLIPGHGTSAVPHEYTYVDTSADLNDYYRLKQIDLDGTVHYSEGVRPQNIKSTTTNTSIPETFQLDQNYPNPFNPSTTIRYGIPQRSQVTLTVFNILGQRVANLVHGQQEAGSYEVKFDGSNLASGVYFYRIQAGSFVQTKKLLLLH